MPIIKAEKLKYEYKTASGDEKEAGRRPVTALWDLDLEVEEGQFIGIIGSNGSGKSTLAKNINALLLPDGGTMYVGGMDTKDSEKLLDIRRMAGMVFQNPDNQIVAAVVEDDVAFGPENLGVPTEEIRQRVDSALHATDMLEYATASPDRLSGGQKQRVAIAGVLAMLPRCIILDEATAMLDPSGRDEVLREVKLLNKNKGITIIHITHNMEELTEADKIFVMEMGQIVMSGSPQEIFSHVTELKMLRLDVPPMTELAYELRQQGLEIPENILTIEDMADAICRSSWKK